MYVQSTVGSRVVFVVESSSSSVGDLCAGIGISVTNANVNEVRVLVLVVLYNKVTAAVLRTYWMGMLSGGRPVLICCPCIWSAVD